MGGEKAQRLSMLGCVAGSPPHGRGKVFRAITSADLIRITPAWAGKSFAQLCFCFFYKDHPRMGGEKEEAKGKDADTMGSPPHGRGKATFARFPCRPWRITPAWAGKRYRFLSSGQCIRDHPRMGGEKISPKRLIFLHLGSPPHGRGKVPQQPLQVAALGITPAWAGKSFLLLCRRCRSRITPAWAGKSFFVGC